MIPQNNSKAIHNIRATRPIDLYKDFKSNITEEEFRRKCGHQNIWHSVDLGDLFIEGARKTSAVLAKENHLMDWPDLRGKSVLDIGAWGGWFSFEAERRGAASVTAIDYYSWVYDWPKILNWIRNERIQGHTPDPYSPPEHLIDLESAPGKLVFDTTRDILGSNVKSVITTAEDFNSDPFDLVIYAGVLYHTQYPLYSLQKVANLTNQQLIIETLGVHIPANENIPLWEFYGKDEINNDPTTWWAPNEEGLKDMLTACGFSKVQIKSGTNQLNHDQLTRKQSIRIWAHAWK